MSALLDAADRDRSVDLIIANRGLFNPKFGEWLLQNWSLWRRFEAEAGRAYSAGRRHYSARTIIEYMRHETNVREAHSSFKINNDHVPDLARLFVLFYPDRADFFEFRSSDSRAQPKGAKERLREAVGA